MSNVVLLDGCLKTLVTRSLVYKQRNLGLYLTRLPSAITPKKCQNFKIRKKTEGTGKIISTEEHTSKDKGHRKENFQKSLYYEE